MSILTMKWLLLESYLSKETNMRMSAFVYPSISMEGMELDSTEEIGRVDVDYGQAPRYTLHSKTSFINAEAVRKLFGAQNYLEMIECIKERFHEETAYEDFQNYLHENKII